jgi:hypothetical protein
MASNPTSLLEMGGFVRLITVDRDGGICIFGFIKECLPAPTDSLRCGLRFAARGQLQAQIRKVESCRRMLVGWRDGQVAISREKEGDPGGLVCVKGQ